MVFGRTRVRISELHTLTAKRDGGFNAPGIAGRKLGSLKSPVKTVLIAEGGAFIPWRGNEPKRPLSPQNARFNDAKDLIFRRWTCQLRPGFIGAQTTPQATAMNYDPPPGCDYKWSGD